ncbi:uncharacterized protein LOC144715215 [Wolffia australiana]
MDAFDAYFRRADLDLDGRISGAEAVAFFQGSNLPKQVLAQIWMYCDTSKTGFLGRKEFYNALKLVTVSQRGQQLTPEIVKAATEGPVSAKIPAPQINTASISVPPGSQIGVMPRVPPPNLGQQYSQPGGQYMMPTQANPAISSRPLTGQTLGVMGPTPPVSNTSSLLSQWTGGRPGGTSVGGPLQGPLASAAPQTNASATAPLPARAPEIRPPLQPPVKDSKPMITAVNGFNSAFGNDVFSALSQPTQDRVGGIPGTSARGPLSTGMPTTFGSVQSVQALSSSILSQGGNQFLGPQSVPKQSQNEAAQSVPSSSISSRGSWPRFSQNDVQKYSKVFVEVDTDKDGKITGEQARNLFLSWKLPREILKQVWDLSDQDNDSMLSHREFVIALYLLERHREGYPLPAELPNSVKFDETLLQATSASPAWQPNAGPMYQMMPGMRPMLANPGANSQTGILVPQQIDAGARRRHKQPGDVLRKDDGKVLSSNFQDEKAPREKMLEMEPEKEILDSKEKMEFYRSKMQELVLYKSKCDNRLNEITDKALADRSEVEGLAKKYEEKYKLVGELASKLAIEEASFRDTQQRKVELHHAIATMERGGSADGLLQVRVDRIHADLEGLTKALDERCKKHGVDIKSTGILELPFGWEPGVKEGAAEWDDDWDKYEDEGFVLSKEDGSFISMPRTRTSVYPDDVSSVTSTGNADGNSVKPGYAQSENGNQFPEFSSPRSAAFDASPRAVYSPSARSETSVGNFADDVSWGAAFDMGSDADSVSDFNSKDSFFGPGDFGLSPIRTGSPVVREKNPVFADSVPSTPQFSYSSSPQFSSGFDSFNRFDSFSTTTGSLARFDSVRSTSDRSQRFDSFDTDPFGYSGPFKAVDSSSPKQESSKWNAF